eukprot:m51a1_g13667 hypothetical protein (344) ;mRNA; f:1-1465
MPSAEAAAEPAAAEAHGTDGGEAGDGLAQPPLSKRQRKRMEKQAKYEEQRKERHRLQKEKRKAARAEERERRRNGEPEPVREVYNLRDVPREPAGTICIDMSFADRMTEKDTKALVNQMCFSYGASNRQAKPLNMVMTSFTGPIVAAMNRMEGFKHWRGVSTDERHYTDVWDRSRIVYLCAEAREALGDFDSEAVYVIGGLVDHNRFKGLTYGDATARGIRTARLPIDEYLEMRTRKVLTVNQVFEIMLQLANCGSWQAALERIMPRRKHAQLKQGEAEAEGEAKEADGVAEAEGEAEEAKDSDSDSAAPSLADAAPSAAPEAPADPAPAVDAPAAPAEPTPQ